MKHIHWAIWYGEAQLHFGQTASHGHTRQNGGESSERGICSQKAAVSQRYCLFPITAYSVQGHGGPVAYPKVHWAGELPGLDSGPVQGLLIDSLKPMQIQEEQANCTHRAQGGSHWSRRFAVTQNAKCRPSFNPHFMETHMDCQFVVFHTLL